MKKLVPLLLLFLCSSNAFSEVAFDGNGLWSTSFVGDNINQLDADWVNSTGLPDGLEKWTNNGFTTLVLVDGIGTDNWELSTGAPTKYYYKGTAFTGVNNTAPRAVGVGGELVADGAIVTSDWNDYDTLGADTLYVVSATDPDIEAYNYVYCVVSRSQADATDNYSSINTSFNNALGPGGAFGAFIGDGNSVGTGQLRIKFAEGQTELWVRWYVRDVDLAWESISSDKQLYLHTTASNPTQLIPEYQNTIYKLATQGTGITTTITAASGYGWPYMQGGATTDPVTDVTADGEWHCFEAYLKMDTNGVFGVAGGDGVGRFWFDGELLAESTGENFSGGFSDAQDGWLYIEFEANQANPFSRVSARRYYDDMVIINNSSNTDLKDDGNGNLFIGPIPAASTGGQPVSIGTGESITIGAGESVTLY